MAKTIRILISGTLIAVAPTTDRVFDLLAPRLRYTTKVFLRGRAAYLARKEDRAVVQTKTYDCFTVDVYDRLITQLGFLERVQAALESAGYRVKVEDVRPHPDPAVYAPQWDRVLGDPDIRLRYKQEEVLRIFTEHRTGRIDCPTGYGKSFLMGLAALMHPKATFDILTRGVPVLRDRIYPELCQMLPSVGIVGGGLRREGHRVMCYTFGSLHHGREDADFVLVDEAHQAAADDAAAKWGRYGRARIFGLSASHDMRLDGKDLRVEGLCGPVRLAIPYAEARDHGMVVPIEVHWSDVIMDIDPCGDAVDAEKQRRGIWANAHRNRLIAHDARRYPDAQVLIVCNTFEHALHLKRVLPEFKLMYNGASIKASDMRYYAREGLIPAGFEMMTDERRARITRLFERGKLRRVIATTVWNVGVSMNHLQVLIRADAGGSPINDIQIPGRASRVDGTKEVGIVRDYRDFFNSGFARKSAGREKSYARLGWAQHYPARADRTALQRLMEWGD